MSKRVIIYHCAQQIELSEMEIKACISGLGWEIDQCDCGRPGDDIWVAAYEALIKKLKATIKEKEDDD